MPCSSHGWNAPATRRWPTPSRRRRRKTSPSIYCHVIGYHGAAAVRPADCARPRSPPGGRACSRRLRVPPEHLALHRTERHPRRSGVGQPRGAIRARGRRGADARRQVGLGGRPADAVSPDKTLRSWVLTFVGGLRARGLRAWGWRSMELGKPVKVEAGSRNV